MKPRKWIIVAGLLVLIAAGGLYYAKRSLEKNRNLERFLVEHISPAVGGTFDVARVRLGFFSIDLIGVKIVIPLQFFSLTVQDIKIGFSFFKLLIFRGDFSKSINKIILVEPLLEVAFPGPDPGPGGGGAVPDSVTFSPEAFPVEHLLVKNCVVRLIDQKGDKITIGEQLTGRIWGQDTDLNFELNGKLAARKRNLYLTGVFSPKTKKQHLSIRLDKARINKSIRWQRFAVISGKLDGVCEVSFSDAPFPYNIDAHGWVTIEDGIVKVDKVERVVKDVSLKVLMERNEIRLDTVTAQWNNMNVTCRGFSGLSEVQESRFFIKLDGISPRNFSALPEQIQKSVSGEGWVTVDAFRKKNTRKFNVDVSAGGFAIGDKSIRRIAGKCSFTKESVVVDTIFFEYPGISVGAAGLLNFEKSPLAYSFSVRLNGKAETFFPDLSGRFSATGEVHGLGDEPLVTLQVAGKNVSYNDIALGNPLFSVIKRNQSILIHSKESPGAYISFDGSIDNIQAPQPKIHMDTEIYRPIIRNVLKNIPVNTFDITDVKASVTGLLPNPAVKGTLTLKGEKISGDCRFHLFKNDTMVPYSFHLSGENVNFADTLFPVSVSGTLSDDTVSITAFNVLDGISGSGFIKTGSDGFLDLEIHVQEVDLDKMNFLFPGNEKVIRKGYINGEARVFGKISRVQTRMHLNIRQFNLAGIPALQTDAVIRTAGKEFTILPFVIRKNKRIIFLVDTVSNKEHLSFSGSFKNVDISYLLGTVMPDEYDLRGLVTGTFSTSKEGMPVRIHLYADPVQLNSWKFDSVNAHLSLAQNGITLQEISATDSSRSVFSAGGVVPWSFLDNTVKEKDTLHFSLKAEGDLIASLEHNFPSAVGGNGQGELFVDFSVSSESWFFHKAYASIPEATVTVIPFVPDKIKNSSLTLRMDNSSRLHMSFSGFVDKKPVSIFTSHTIPEGFEPIMAGPVNCGVFMVKTPKNGVPLRLPGFMEKGARVDMEFAPRKPFSAFACTGPLDRLKVYGTWVIRNTEFTFPLLEDEFPIPPYTDWELDLRPGNRKVAYFYNIGGKKRRLLRFTECFLDPSSTLVKIRGRDIDGTFRILGKIRSYRGFVFYGRNFERNVNVGVDFVPQKMENGKAYDNLPIIWGSAETFSDTSRFDRIKLTLLVRDPKTGSLREKGRFTDITFRVSSDFEEIPGEAEMEFYQEAGLNFITFKRAGQRAGEMVSSMGDQYINRYFLQRIERKLAKRLGLDVISFETSIASNYFNYFYNSHDRLGNLAQQWDYLAFANVGVTLGRYFLRDKVFLKWRTELTPKDLLLTPEHSIGLEYQPMEYFWVDFNYGFFRNEEDLMQVNPKLRMQLRVPITKFRKYFDF